MSMLRVPITRLRSGAVSVFAASTIAFTSARGETPRSFAMRVDAAVHATSPFLSISCATE